MENQFNEILDNLNEEEIEEQEIVTKEKHKKVEKIETEEEKEETKSIVRFRLFMVLLFVAIALLGILVTQIVLLSLK